MEIKTYTWDELFHKIQDDSDDYLDSLPKDVSDEEFFHLDRQWHREHDFIRFVRVDDIPKLISDTLDSAIHDCNDVHDEWSEAEAFRRLQKYFTKLSQSSSRLTDASMKSILVSDLDKNVGNLQSSPDTLGSAQLNPSKVVSGRDNSLDSNPCHCSHCNKLRNSQSSPDLVGGTENVNVKLKSTSGRDIGLEKQDSQKGNGYTDGTESESESSALVTSKPIYCDECQFPIDSCRCNNEMYKYLNR